MDTLPMQLARPEWLWFFAVLPLLALGAARARARRSRDWSALGQGGRPASSGAVFWLLAASGLAVALTQPRWGRSEGPPTPPGHDVVIAVDVSRSMRCRDAVPDRLGVAVESAEALIAALGREPGDRVAVVAFAGRGVLRCPLTGNLGAAVETLHSLRGGTVPTGGTDLAAGLDAARDAFDDQDHAEGRSVVVFSDGEDHVGHWQAAAERLRARGVIAHAVALGDADTGHVVPTPAGPLRYRGEVVLSRRSDEALAGLAKATGGAFVPLGLATTDMARLYQTRIEPGARGVRRATLTQGRVERFPLFLLVALAFVLAASWPTRPGLRVAWGLGVALLAGLTGANPRDDPAAAIAEGRAAYAAGQYTEALQAFRLAGKIAPANPIATFDTAAALFQLGRFEEAQTLYQQARPRGDARLQAKIDYALGNTAAALGDVSNAIRHYDDCLASTATGSDLDRVREDAAINRRFIKEHASGTPPTPSDPGDKPPSKEVPAKGTSPQKDGKTPGTGKESGNPGDGSSSGKRGAGGAGGSGLAPPQPGSPEDQLARALDQVRNARRGRIDDSPAPVEREEGKDW